MLAGRTALAARSKRTLVLATAAVAVIGVICGVWIAFPGLTATLAQNFEQLTGKSASAAAPHLATAAHHGHHGPAARRRAGGGTGGSGGTGGTAPPTRSTPPAGRHTPGTPRPSGKASPSGNRSPSGHPTPSQSPSPSPTPSPTGARGGPRPLPPGYAWHSVSPASVGSTAGFRLAAPVHWLMYPALVTVFRPPAGSIRMKVNMTPSAAAGPVRRARHAQASATAAHRYPHYHLVSILAVTFHGYPAATWTFWWRPPGSLVAVDMTEVFFTISTAAGPQSYVLIMSTPATRADWASKVFRVAMRTFRPLP